MENISNKDYIANKLIVRISFALKGNELMDKEITDKIHKEICYTLQEYDYIIAETIKQGLLPLIQELNKNNQ